MAWKNVYDEAERAAAYAELEFDGTYFLAFRDLPGILAAHVRGRSALDFGCGAGRSTRFLKGLGFETIGVDVAEEMLEHARAKDPGGRYLRIEGDRPGELGSDAYDLILAAFTFDNIPTEEQKGEVFQRLRHHLGPDGRIVTIVSAPEIYTHEWVSFSTKDFPENRAARSGDRVRIIITDGPDRRPVEDIVCTEQSYRRIYERAGLELMGRHAPLGRPDEPIPWVTERDIAPWVIDVLGSRIGDRPEPA